jgi:hypothetical protein
VQKIATEIFESRGAVHSIFIFIFLALFCLPAVFSSVPASRIINILLLGLYFLICVYAGRWICRKWLSSSQLIQFVIYSAIALLVLSLIGIIGLKQFSRDNGAGMIISLVSVVAGFLLLGTFLSVTRSAMLRQLKGTGPLKPFSLENILASIDKVTANLDSLEKRVPVTDPDADNHFFIKADGKIYKIDYNELLYAEAQGNNTKVVTEKRVLMPNISFTNFEKLLPLSQFIRIHRSFIINKSKIDHIEGNRLFIIKTEIPIGSNYRDSFLKRLGI